MIDIELDAERKKKRVKFFSKEHCMQVFWYSLAMGVIKATWVKIAHGGGW
jgi:hypothetical protein